MQMMIREANDLDMLEIMRIRNSGREFMTHYTAKITPEEQIEWWYSPMRQSAYIWIAEIDNEPIGFCMIREMIDSGRMYGTLAVLPEHRGKGIGTQLYQFMRNITDELWIEIRNDNLASMNAALRAGFQIYYIGANITELVGRS